ncbi:MAG: response regulator transcription factor [Lachnospiraceae bacterium]|nr:response regulator transcription factor [Lachnospiraceae bacterium]
MVKIYYADDEKEIRDVVGSFLRNEGYEVKIFETGDLLYEEFIRTSCDLVLLDIMMPGSDGIEILQKIRRQSKVPVILLTAKDTDVDYYNGMSLGGDDYLIKPFRPLILSAKIKAVLRRVRFEKEQYDKNQVHDIVCGNLCFLKKQYQVLVDDKEVSLTPTEMRFLEYMMEHFEEAVKREVILDELWNIDNEVESRVADETARRLRKKLVNSGSNVYIQTVWGYGFRLTNRENCK